MLYFFFAKLITGSLALFFVHRGYLRAGLVVSARGQRRSKARRRDETSFFLPKGLGLGFTSGGPVRGRRGSNRAFRSFCSNRMHLSKRKACEKVRVITLRRPPTHSPPRVKSRGRRSVPRTTGSIAHGPPSGAPPPSRGTVACLVARARDYDTTRVVGARARTRNTRWRSCITARRPTRWCSARCSCARAS
jgi:hypothetical protein